MTMIIECPVCQVQYTVENPHVTKAIKEGVPHYCCEECQIESRHDQWEEQRRLRG